MTIESSHDHCIQDGTKVFTASCDKTAKLWDLQANQAIAIAQVSKLLWLSACNGSLYYSTMLLLKLYIGYNVRAIASW